MFAFIILNKLVKNTYPQNTHFNINGLQEASNYWTNSPQI